MQRAAAAAAAALISAQDRPRIYRKKNLKKKAPQIKRKAETNEPTRDDLTPLNADETAWAMKKKTRNNTESIRTGEDFSLLHSSAKAPISAYISTASPPHDGSQFEAAAAVLIKRARAEEVNENKSDGRTATTTAAGAAATEKGDENTNNAAAAAVAHPATPAAAAAAISALTIQSSDGVLNRLYAGVDLKTPKSDARTNAAGYLTTPKKPDRVDAAQTTTNAAFTILPDCKVCVSKEDGVTVLEEPSVQMIILDLNPRSSCSKTGVSSITTVAYRAYVLQRLLTHSVQGRIHPTRQSHVFSALRAADLRNFSLKLIPYPAAKPTDEGDASAHAPFWFTLDDDESTEAAAATGAAAAAAAGPRARSARPYDVCQEGFLRTCRRTEILTSFMNRRAAIEERLAIAPEGVFARAYDVQLNSETESVVIRTDLLQYSMEEWLRCSAGHTFANIRVCIQNAIGSVYALHRLGVIHRYIHARHFKLDVPKNIFSLIDFDRAAVCTAGCESQTSIDSDDACMSCDSLDPATCPPELMNASGLDTQSINSYAIDCWALGCLLYSVVTGEDLIDWSKSKSSKPSSLRAYVGEQLCLQLSPEEFTKSNQYQKFTEALKTLAKTAEEVAAIEPASVLLQWLLHLDPTKRLSALEASYNSYAHCDWFTYIDRFFDAKEVSQAPSPVTQATRDRRQINTS